MVPRASAWLVRASPRRRLTTSPCAAGLSRATAYRAFPRGKEGILAAVVETEVARLFSASSPSSWARRATSKDVLVAGTVESARWLRDHARRSSYLLEHEPATVLPYVTFGGFDQVMRVASDLGAPFFARWLEPEQASRAAEWAVRIVMAYCSDPSPHADLADPEDTRALVRTFVAPGILALRLEAGARSHCLPGGASISPSSSTSPSPTNHTPEFHHSYQGGGTMTTLDENTTDQLRSNLDLIGREEINDLEAVLNFVGEYDV